MGVSVCVFSTKSSNSNVILIGSISESSKDPPTFII